jgi:hypothetical protein
MDFHLDFSIVLGTAPNPAARRFFDFTRQWQAARDEMGAGGLKGDRFAEVPVASARLAPV